MTMTDAGRSIEGSRAPGTAGSALAAGPLRAASLYVFLALAMVLGGAGVSYPLLHLLIVTSALFALALHVPVLLAHRLAPVSRTMLGLAFATLAVVAAQAAPLPGDVWRALPGHELAAQIADIAQVRPWHSWSLAPDRAAVAFVSLVPAGAALVLTAHASAARRRTLLLLVCGVAVAQALLAILQIAAGADVPLILFDTTHRGVGVGLFVNRNHLAVLLLVAIPWIMLLATLPSEAPVANAKLAVPAGGAGRMLGLASLVVLAVGVLASLSRVGVFLLAPVLLAAVVLAQRGRPRLGVFAGGVAGLLLATGLIAQTDLMGRLLARFATTADDKRFLYWDNTLLLIREYLPLGSGFGTFPQVYQAVEPLDQVGPTLVNHAHNDVLEIVLEGGLPAALLLLGWLVAIALAFGAARRRGASPFTRRAPLAALTGIVVILAASLVDYPARMTTISVVLALLIGMLLPAPGAAQRRTGGALGASACYAAVVTVGLLAISVDWSARLVSIGRDDLAVRIAPWWSGALAVRAAQLELAGQSAAAGDVARRALAIAPLNAGAARGSALADLGTGNPRRGAALMSISAQLGWRDPLIQSWLVERALAAHADTIAAQRIDALLRQGLFPDQVLPLLAPLVTTPQGRTAVAERLAYHPGWRVAFFNTVARAPGWRLEDLLVLMATLSRLDAPAGSSETALIRAVLADRGDFAAVRQLWLASGGTGLIGDGGFGGAVAELPTGAAPFAWRAPPIAGLRAEIARPDTPVDGPALLLTGDGLSQGEAVVQTVALSAGRYRIGFSALADDRAILAAVGLGVRCRLGTGEEPGAFRPLAIGWRPGPKGWSQAQAILDVPESCPGQDIALQIPARGGQSFAIWFDSVSIRAERASGT